ncbi:MAG: hypothetical protein ABIH50_04410 [bacterium]
MISRVINSGGNRNASPYTLLKVSPHADEHSHSYFSRGAIKVNKVIDFKKVEGLVPIFLRSIVSPIRISHRRVFISNEEAEQIAGHFGLEPEVIPGGVFINLVKWSPFFTIFTPSWTELLNRESRTSFTAWLAQPTSTLPSPSRFTWSTLPYGFLPFPTFPNVKKISNLGVVEGEFRWFFDSSSRRAGAGFSYNGQASRFISTLSKDPFRPIASDKKSDETGSLDPERFKKLFQKSPEETTYEFTKICTNCSCFSLPSVNGISINIMIRNIIKFKLGALYYFTATREGSRVLIKAYSDEERREEVLSASILIQGKFYYNGFATPLSCSAR